MGEVHTEKLCVGKVCVNETGLRALLINSGVSFEELGVEPVGDSTPAEENPASESDPPAPEAVTATSTQEVEPQNSEETPPTEPETEENEHNEQ